MTLMADRGLERAVDALLMFHTASQTGDGAEAPYAVLAAYGERLQLAGQAAVEGRAADAGAIFAEILGNHLRLEMLVMARLIYQTGEQPEALLREVLDEPQPPA
jgi:hypothetical protein